MFLNLDQNILFNIVNILVLFLLLRRFLFRPVTKMMDERREAIRRSIEKAEAGEQHARTLNAQYEARLADARQEAARIVQEAKEQAAREGDKLLRQARAGAGKLLDDARRQAAAERERAMQEVRGQVAGLALAAAAKLAQKNMDAEAGAAFVDAFLSDAGVKS